LSLVVERQLDLYAPTLICLVTVSHLQAQEEAERQAKEEEQRKKQQEKKERRREREKKKNEAAGEAEVGTRGLLVTSMYSLFPSGVEK
jgi:hypothetical protein